MAIRKTTTQVGIAKPGEDVTFTIEVFNQGTVTAENIDVIDYLPEFVTLSSNDTNGWTGNGNTVTNTIASLAPGASTTINMVVTIVPDAMTGSYENGAEITDAQDENGNTPNDVDSTPDTNPDNDTLVDDEINNGGGDEDDQDIAPIEICDDKAPELVGVPADLTLECSETIPTPPVIDCLLYTF